MDTEPDDKPTGQPRNGHGQYAHDPAAVDQDLKVYDLRLRGRTFDAIAKELGIGQSTAHDAFHRVLRSRRVEASDDARQLERDRLQAQLNRCDEREQDLLRRLEKRHILVQQGRVILTDDGEHVEDDDIALKIHAQLTAIERLRDSTHQRIVALDGLAIPTTQQVSQQITYTIKGLDND